MIQGLKVGGGITVINLFCDFLLAGDTHPWTPVEIHDDLDGKVLVFDNGHDQNVLGACNLVELPRAEDEDTRQRIQKSFAIPTDLILISAAHSHM